MHSFRAVVLVLASGLTSCTCLQKDAPSAAVPPTPSAPLATAVPEPVRDAGTPPGVVSTFAQLEGWHGVKFTQDPERRGALKVVFPAEFGLRDESEWNVLLAVVKRDLEPEQGLLGYYDALAQLVRLAAESQHRPAAEVIFRADTPQGMDLGGGEVSEVHGPVAIVPALLGYEDVNGVVTKELFEHVARSACMAFIWDPGDDVKTDLPTLTAALRRKKAGALAAEIERCFEEETAPASEP